MQKQTIICPKCTHCFVINDRKRKVKFNKRKTRSLHQTNMRSYFLDFSQVELFYQDQWEGYNNLITDMKQLKLDN